MPSLPNAFVKDLQEAWLRVAGLAMSVCDIM